jgi:hypothetical protein
MKKLVTKETRKIHGGGKIWDAIKKAWVDASEAQIKSAGLRIAYAQGKRK